MKRNYYFVATSLALLSLFFLTFQLFEAASVNPTNKLELASKAEPTPEFGATSQVLVTDLLLTDYGAVELIREIIQAGSMVHFLTNRKLTRKADFRWLKALGFDRQEIQHMHFTNVAFDSPWLRDYGPILGKAQNGTPQFFQFQPEQATSRDAVVVAKLGQSMSINTSKVTTVLSGGNLLTNGSLCFSSGEDFKSVDALKYELGCKRVVYFSKVPHPHVDMWAKILNSKTVAVSEISQTTLNFAKRRDGFVTFDLQKLHDDLDELAAALARDLTVVRIPMPMPFRNTFRNYANAIIVNKTMIVPSYKVLGWNYDQYPDSELSDYYEEQVKTVYSKFGYKVHFVNADKLILAGVRFIAQRSSFRFLLQT